MGKQPVQQPRKIPRSHQIINQAALFLFLYLVLMGVLRLVTVMISTEVLPLRPVDGWMMMSLRVIAVCCSIGMFFIQELRKRYLLLLIALLMLTSAGLWLRLASLLPDTWHAAAGIGQYLMAVSGMGLVAAAILQGEDLAGFIRDTWSLSGRQALEKLRMGDDRER